MHTQWAAGKKNHKQNITSLSYTLLFYLLKMDISITVLWITWQRYICQLIFSYLKIFHFHCLSCSFFCECLECIIYLLLINSLHVFSKCFPFVKLNWYSGSYCFIVFFYSKFVWLSNRWCNGFRNWRLFKWNHCNDLGGKDRQSHECHRTNSHWWRRFSSHFVICFCQRTTITR